MSYESSYESGRTPYTPDVKRGKWANPKDFIWACMTLALKMDFISVIWAKKHYCGSVGYMCLLVNIIVIYELTLFAALPLFFLFNSLSPTLPWSCEGTKNISTICKDIFEDENLNITLMTHELPAAVFFKQHFYGFEHYANNTEPSVSFYLIALKLLTWGLIAVIFYFCQETEKFGVFLRYGFWTAATLLMICFVRFSFLPGAANALHDFFVPDIDYVLYSSPLLTLYIMKSFGGYGTITSLASFNDFKFDIMIYGWIICLGQMLIMFAYDLLLDVTEAHFEHIYDSSMGAFSFEAITLVSTATVISNMSFANLWSILFYGFLTLNAIILISIQLFTILTSLNDEFVFLRSRKREVTFGVIAIFGISSLYFSTSFGIAHFMTLADDLLLSQVTLSLLLIFILFWVYGRERFQRDIQFMLTKPFSNFRVFMLRFISPIVLTFLIFGVFMMLYFKFTVIYSLYISIISLIHMIIFWLFLPAYVIYLLVQSSGSFLMRLKRACRPNDWYPIDTTFRQKYEEALNNLDITHQLTELTGDEIY